jgi:hypothetical protein
MLATFSASMLITITVVIKLLAAMEELSHHGIRATAHGACVCPRRRGLVPVILSVKRVAASVGSVAGGVLSAGSIRSGVVAESGGRHGYGGRDSAFSHGVISRR